MRRMLSSGVMLLCLAALPANGGESQQREIDPAFRADIVKLIKLVRPDTTIHVAVNLAARLQLTIFKESYPGLSERGIRVAQEVLEEELAKFIAGPDGLLDRMVPTIAELLSHEEVRSLIEFFESPLGRKYVASELPLGEEAGVAGRDWAFANWSRIKGRVEERWQAEGITAEEIVVIDDRAWRAGADTMRVDVRESVMLEVLPEALSQIVPEYPESAQEIGLEGTVHVRMLVLADGRVGQAMIASTTDVGFNRAALVAAMQWRFKPAVGAGGANQAAWVLVPIKFKLR